MEQTALKEARHYDKNAAKTRVPVQKEIKLYNVLDLTDPAIRKQLGVKYADITHGSDYSKTQRIGKWAKEYGYDGRLAPSARNEGDSNIVILKDE